MSLFQPHPSHFKAKKKLKAVFTTLEIRLREISLSGQAKQKRSAHSTNRYLGVFVNLKIISVYIWE